MTYVNVPSYSYGKTMQTNFMTATLFLYVGGHLVLAHVAVSITYY